MTSAPRLDAPWAPLAVRQLSGLLAGREARWWLSGGVALEHWLGRPIREHGNVDVSTLRSELPALLADLPAPLSAWAILEEDVVPAGALPEETDVQRIGVHDDQAHSWVLQVNVEDGTDAAWLYRRDPRVQLPWDRAVLDVDGIPTGSPAIQLLWKALRPRPVDDADKDAVWPELTDEQRSWLETALLRVHPHSTWAIHVRSPFAPARASWNRTRR